MGDIRPLTIYMVFTIYSPIACTKSSKIDLQLKIEIRDFSMLAPLRFVHVEACIFPWED